MQFKLTLLLALPSILMKNGILAVEENKNLAYEEYIVEHEISSSQAKNAALSIDLNSIVSPAGCQKCTRSELRYCLGGDLISDHCCCDRRYHEVLPFIPHTCYLGTQICKPIVADCAEYTRLRRCCCDKYVLQKWKQKSASPSNSTIHKGLTTLCLVYFLYIFVNYLT